MELRNLSLFDTPPRPGKDVLKRNIFPPSGLFFLPRPVVLLDVGAAKWGLGGLRKGVKKKPNCENPRETERCEHWKKRKQKKSFFRTRAGKEPASTGSGQEAVCSALMGTELESAVVSVCGKKGLESSYKYLFL